MKNICALLFVLFSHLSFSQCLVSLGPDLAFCPGDSVGLGLNLLTNGFTAPLSYTWEANRQWPIGSTIYNFYASDFIDDTTSANPKIISLEEGVLVFKLTVTDANGLSCADSLAVHYSMFIFTLASPRDYFINEGDSVYCQGWQNISGTVPPFQYLWSPTVVLANSTGLAFWAKPDTTTLYRLIVTDSLGCSEMGPGSYRVHVNPLSVHENLASHFSVYPNPAKGKVNIKNTSGLQIEAVVILDLSTKVVWRTHHFNGDEVDLSELSGGTYVLQFETDEGLVSKRLVVY